MEIDKKRVFLKFHAVKIENFIVRCFFDSNSINLIHNERLPYNTDAAYFQGESVAHKKVNA